MNKVRYELDPHNCLILTKTGEKGKFGVRRVLEGRFRVQNGNSLTYHVKSPLSGTGDYPHQIKLKGTWGLSPENRLEFLLDKWGRQTFGDKLTFAAALKDAGKNSLTFSLITKSKTKTTSFYTLKLNGQWQADPENRILFLVKKNSGPANQLTFNCSWASGPNGKISINTDNGKNKIRLNGKWETGAGSRLSHVIDRTSGSVFNFKTDWERFTQNGVRYSLGIGIKGRKDPVRRILTFTGSWRIKSGRLELILDNNGTESQALKFGIASTLVLGKNKVQLELKCGCNGKKPGVLLNITRNFLGADAFLKLLKDSKQVSVTAGMGVRW